MEPELKITKKKSKRTLVNTNPTLDSEIATTSKKTVNAPSYNEEFQRDSKEFHEFYGVLLEKAKKIFRKGNIVISSRTSNRSLGQYALRTDSVGRAARAERKRRLSAAKGKKPKIRPAMKSLKRHLKGKHVAPGRLISISKAVEVAAPRTVKSAVRRAGWELKVEKGLAKLKRQAREEGMAAGVKRERQRIRKSTAKASTPSTPAKKTIDVKGNLIKTKGIPTSSDIKKSVHGQVMAQIVKQTMLPKDFDPYYHYIGQDGLIYKWDSAHLAKGKQRPIPGTIRALIPKTDVPHEVEPASGTEEKLAGGPVHPTQRKWKLKVPRWGVKQEPQKPEIQAVENPAPKGPIDLKPAPPSKGEIQAKANQRHQWNIERTKELDMINFKYLNRKGTKIVGLTKAKKRINEMKYHMEKEQWEKYWEMKGFKPDDPLVKGVNRFTGESLF